MASEEDNHHHDVVSIDLPAPSGWTKKFTPRKSGTPLKNEIIFISPNGEEIKNKRQLDQYLKSHPGGPSASEFDWGTGDTPRRSTRLSEKSKAVAEPPTQSPKKKPRKSNKNKSNIDEEDKATDEKDPTTEETEENTIVEAKDDMDGEAITEGTPPGKPNKKDIEKKTETDTALQERTTIAPVDANTENTNAIAEESNDATTVSTNAKTEESKETPSNVPASKIDESKEANTEVQDANNDEPKDTSHAEKETPNGSVNNVLDRNNPEEKETAENPVMLEPTGS